MKPYLESSRRIARVGLILFALSMVASAIVSIQYCTAVSHANVPSVTNMFSPLIAFVYIGGVALAMDGFSFLNKRADSDYYHSLPVSRRKLFWAITLGALTWIVSTVLGSVLLTVIIFTLTKTPFVQLYALVAVPFFTIAALLVFAAAAIAMSLTGTALTGLGLTVLVFGLLRFVQFSVARGIVANAQIIGWLDLPWYLTPVTNIATGQLAQLLRPMLRQTLYSPFNMLYSALLAGAELFLARVLFARRPSELAEHGAKNVALQTGFACAAVIPIVMLFASGIVKQRNVGFPVVAGVAAGVYLIYQGVALRSTRKVLLSLPWLLVPLAVGVAGYYGTLGAASAMQNYVPSAQDVAYVQFTGGSRGSESISYQEYRVSQVRFTQDDVIQYAVDTLQDNVSTIRTSGYLNYSYDYEAGYLLETQPVKFVLKNGRTVSRVLTFLNQNTLLTYSLQNSAFEEAIRSLPPQSAVCYLQGDDPYKGGYAAGSRVLSAFYEELPTADYPANGRYTYYDPLVQYNVDDEQIFGSITASGYIGMTRFSDYYNIRRGMPKTASAWMSYQNSRSKGEYLDLMQQMLKKSATLTDEMDYFNFDMTFYNVPMSDGTKQVASFYFSSSMGDGTDELKEQLQPLMEELVSLLLRSEPTIDPNALCVYTNWSGRVHKDDGTYYGAEILAEQMATNEKETFVSGGSIYYVSDGSIVYGGVSGAITSYNPCYRTFAAEDQARLLEILQQWNELQDEFNYRYYGSSSGDGPIIGSNAPYATPTPAPMG